MSIYQHFRNEEIPVIKRFEQLIEKCELSYAPVLTEFLDPRSQSILESLVNRNGNVLCRMFGGHHTERKRALIYPEYYEPEVDDFELVLFEIKYPDKFIELTHRNILGSLMQLGFERDYLGDIITGKTVQFVCAAHLKDYIAQNMVQLKRAKIELIDRDIEDILISEEAYQTVSATVASLRLDSVLSEIIKKSRAIAQKHIAAEHIKVNHMVITKPDFQLDEHDIISIKGYGRARIESIGGRTKKNKIRVIYGTLFK